VRVPVKMSGNGQIVPARDAQALATALIEILENPQPYQGEPGIVTRLSTPEAVAEEYEKAFDQARQLAEGKRLIIRGQAEPAKIKERRAHDRAG
jgi:glycosyltransferase involved in cell wall biosynthesis